MKNVRITAVSTEILISSRALPLHKYAQFLFSFWDVMVSQMPLQICSIRHFCFGVKMPSDTSVCSYPHVYGVEVVLWSCLKTTRKLAKRFYHI
jgi:hypothetical protein